MVSNEWTSAWSSFYDNVWVQAMMIPAGQRAEIRINADPRVDEEAQREQNRRRVQQTSEEREQQFQRARRAVEKGIQSEE